MSVRLFGLSTDLCFSGDQFDAEDAILNALKGLEVNLAIDTGVRLDDCKAYCVIRVICLT